MSETSMRLPNDQDASGRTFGTEALQAVQAALESGTLTSTKGTFVKQLESDFAAKVGVKHAFACTSGTAALHCAVAAIYSEPGEEMMLWCRGGRSTIRRVTYPPPAEIEHEHGWYVLVDDDPEPSNWFYDFVTS